MISNYYEQLVMDRITEFLVDSDLAHDPDYAEDIACVALNQLPARYVRHAVDVSFYMTREERQDIENNVDAVIRKAIEFIERRRNNPPDDRHPS
ncbi:MAG: hypothetical protein FD165_1821 [Gammaproteobacteria bacterium]|nr:MAG: hypothetical protein FD165_1821 [Gammaproteobacteria bacterium]TND04395.1 MAG: hypothetical protein FD120_1509 [Gammaproteobacteria bacterium]